MTEAPERKRLSPAATNPETGRPDAATLNEAFRDIALTLPVVLTD